MPIAPQSDPSARTKVASRTPAPAAPAGAYVVQVSAQTHRGGGAVVLPRTAAEISGRARRRAMRASAASISATRRHLLPRPGRPVRDRRTGDRVLRQPEGRRRPVHRAAELTAAGCLTRPGAAQLSRADGQAPSSPEVEGLSLGARRARVSARRRPLGLHPVPRNVDTPAQVRGLVAALRETVGRNAPVLIDQEGGRVQRLAPPHWPNYPPGALLRRDLRPRPRRGARGRAARRAADRARSRRARHRRRLPAARRRAGAARPIR